MTNSKFHYYEYTEMGIPYCYYLVCDREHPLKYTEHGNFCGYYTYFECTSGTIVGYLEYNKKESILKAYVGQQDVLSLFPGRKRISLTPWSWELPGETPKEAIGHLWNEVCKQEHLEVL